MTNRGTTTIRAELDAGAIAITIDGRPWARVNAIHVAGDVHPLVVLSAIDDDGNVVDSDLDAIERGQDVELPATVARDLAELEEWRRAAAMLREDGRPIRGTIVPDILRGKTLRPASPFDGIDLATATDDLAEQLVRIRASLHTIERGIESAIAEALKRPPAVTEPFVRDASGVHPVCITTPSGVEYVLIGARGMPSHYHAVLGDGRHVYVTDSELERRVRGAKPNEGPLSDEEWSRISELSGRPVAELKAAAAGWAGMRTCVRCGECIDGHAEVIGSSICDECLDGRSRRGEEPQRGGAGGTPTSDLYTFTTRDIEQARGGAGPLPDPMAKLEEMRAARLAALLTDAEVPEVKFTADGEILGTVPLHRCGATEDVIIVPGEVEDRPPSAGPVTCALERHHIGPHCSLALLRRETAIAGWANGAKPSTGETVQVPVDVATTTSRGPNEDA